MRQSLLAEMLYRKVEDDPTGDINLDLWLLRDFAARVNHVTEFGVRSGVSTTAFLAAQPKTLVSYDIDPCSNEKPLRLARGKTKWEFHQESTLETTIEETDLLFIDTLHTYEQLTRELQLHGNKARRYIIFHDTLSYGMQGEDGSTPGLIQAYTDFTRANPRWRVHLISMAQNGLTVLARKDEHANDH